MPALGLDQFGVSLTLAMLESHPLGFQFVAGLVVPVPDYSSHMARAGVPHAHRHGDAHGRAVVIELATNYEIVHGYQSQSGQQAFETPSSAVLDRLLVDTYSLIQSDADLLRDLVRIQREIRKSATRTSLLYARMAGGPGTNGTPDGLLAYLNMCLNSDHAVLKIPLESALRTLRERYGLMNPLGEPG